MTKNDYINTLNRHLSGLSEEEKSEILNDIRDHFDNGISNGKTDDEIASALGDPELLARQYKSDYQSSERTEYNKSEKKSDNSNGSNTSQSSYNQQQAENSQQSSGNNGQQTIIRPSFYESNKNNIPNVILLIVMIFVIISVVPTIFGFWMAGIGISVAGVIALLSSIVPGLHFLNPLTQHNLGAASAFISVGLTCLGLLMLIGMYYLTKLFVKFVRNFKWNI